MRTKPLQLDLLGEATCTTHDRRKEARIANFPELEGQIDGRVTGQVVTFAVEAETGHIFGVPLKYLPLSRGSHIVDADRAVVRADGQTLGVVVEGDHWEDLDHVGQDHRSRG